MLTDIEGIIVKETPYGDTSKIINILTNNQDAYAEAIANTIINKLKI